MRVCVCISIRFPNGDPNGWHLSQIVFKTLIGDLETLPNNESVAVELNLWTRPDCAGTEYENLNRSWFFFSIQGEYLVHNFQLYIKIRLNVI